MYCPSCGCELPDDAVFCKQCGHRIPHPENNETIKPSETSRPSSEEKKRVSGYPVDTDRWYYNDVVNIKEPGMEEASREDALIRKEKVEALRKEKKERDLKRQQPGLTGWDELQQQQASLGDKGDINYYQNEQLKQQTAAYQKALQQQKEHSEELEARLQHLEQQEQQRQVQESQRITYEQNPPEVKVKKSHGKGVAIGIIIALIVIGIIVAAFVIPSINTNDSTPTITSTTTKIVVNTTPSGASVYLNNTYKGTTPLTINVSPSTSYTVKISKNGYVDYYSTVKLASGETKTITATLTKTQSTTTTTKLEVKSTPSSAEVYLNGTYKGNTPLSITVSPSTQYTVRVSKSGYQDSSTTTSVDSGTTRTLTFTLTKAQSTTTTDTNTYAGKAKAIAAAMEPSNSKVRALALNAISSSHEGSSSYVDIEQICDIYDYLLKKWTYVQDPSNSLDYYAKASESASLMKGDCDDFAILMASCIQAIGGSPRIILAWDKSGSGHAYAEVYMTDNKSDANNLINSIGKRYNKNISYHSSTDSNENTTHWLNLDWGDNFPGGRYFPNDGKIMIIYPDGSYEFENFTPSKTY